MLEAARSIGIDIPTLCYLEKCGPLNSCLACLVKINGKLVPSCGTRVEPGMTVESETEEVHSARRTALELLFSDHVGDCLSPCHRLCPLGLNAPVLLRKIQGGQFEEALQMLRSTLPLPAILGRLCHHPCEQGCRRGNWDDPAAIREMEKFLTEGEMREPGSPGVLASPRIPREPPTGRKAVIIGAGPTGLAAAYWLARRGHAVTVVDRHPEPGGSLRSLPEATLPAAALALDLAHLRWLGIEFKLGVELGNEVRIDGLSRGFDAILLTIGQCEPGEGDRIGLPLLGPGLRADPNTCQTPLPKVFAAGAAVKPVKQLVRAMGEGQAAAECVDRFLKGKPARRPEKAISSFMGRLDPAELRRFLLRANSGGSVAPCDRCAGLSRLEAATEAARCLHCDCRSSGNCVLQHYAQVYGAEPGRFRAERREFEQQLQPGGVIFEPGKCILCGICVRLTEMARDPLGLTFIGRGFDMKIGAPFGKSIEEGLRNLAKECVDNCPTGALAFGESRDISGPERGAF